MARPLTEILRQAKNQEWDFLTEKQVVLFEKLKYCLAKLPFLALPMADRPCMIDTDASEYALGAVLLQKQDLDDS